MGKKLSVKKARAISRPQRDGKENLKKFKKMSTTFAVRVPSVRLYEDGEEDLVKVAFRSNGVRWLDPLAQLLPDDTEVIAVDNSPQGIYTIGDIRERIEKK